jgi:hypothetical protein
MVYARVTTSPGRRQKSVFSKRGDHAPSKARIPNVADRVTSMLTRHKTCEVINLLILF